MSEMTDPCSMCNTTSKEDLYLNLYMYEVVGVTGISEVVLKLLIYS